MNRDNRIDMHGMGKRFFATRALDKVNFSCVAGEVHALVGLNGAGKSTLMKVLGGVISADEGVITLNGNAVQITEPAAATALGISMIHQEYSLINELSVAGNIFLGRELKRGRTPFLHKSEMARQVTAQLERFGLRLDPHQTVRELNSGEKQIVEIIRSLMSDSWLIVMDEPTSALSEEDKQRLFEFINRMKAEGISIIYISHHMPEIFGIADRVTVMKDGQIVLTEPTGNTTEEAVIHAMTGQELEGFVKPHKQATGEVLLSVQQLSKPGHFDKLHFDVHRGEIVVLTGLRGCGAPELAKAIFGLDGHYTGDVIYRSTTLSPGRGPAAAVRDGMGLVTENRDKNGILAPLSVRDNIALPFLEKRASRGLIDGSAIERLVTRAIDETSTKTSSPDQEIRFLSGGNKQKICFSRWLDKDLELLILLEPTRGIDVHAKADIYRIIESLAEAGFEVDDTVRYLTYAAESARRIQGEIFPADAPNEQLYIYRVPYGVTIGICAYNYPLALIGRKLGPALVTGNVMILKPHEATPVTGSEFCRLVQAAGVPAGVVGLLTGGGPDLGAALVESPLTRLISVTGSIRAGQAIAAGAAQNLAALSLELGGNAPFIVLKDADIDRAVEAAAVARFANAGQVCICNESVLVEQAVANEFTHKLLKRVAQVQLGNPMTNAGMGPVTTAASVSRVEKLVQASVEAGAEVVAGGKRGSGPGFDQGHWYEPTVLTGAKADSPAVVEEIFGPVLPVVSVADYEEALSIANGRNDGLSAYLWTRDTATYMDAIHRLETGTIFLNKGIVGYIQGYHNGHKRSGLGGEDGVHGIEGYLQKRTVYMQY